jgi:hypothetical protein
MLLYCILRLTKPKKWCSSLPKKEARECSIQDL